MKCIAGLLSCILCSQALNVVLRYVQVFTVREKMTDYWRTNIIVFYSQISRYLHTI